jgi:ATP-binding cassette, subfamily B, bacterial
MQRSQPPLKRLFKYGRKYRLTIWLAVICSILNKLFDLAPPTIIGIAVDVLVNGNNSLIARFGFNDLFGQIVFLALLNFVIWCFESLFEYIYDRLWRNLAQNIQHDLRLDAYSHLQDLELAYFEERSTGRLLAILNDDINQLERFLDIGANEIIQVITSSLIIAGSFFYLTPNVAWLALLPMPFILWGSIAFQKLLAPRYADVREKVSLLSDRLANNLGGITTIKSFTTEAYESDRLRQESEGYRQSNSKAIALSAAFVPLIRFAILFGFTALLLYGGREVIQGRLAVGAYSTLLFLIQRLLWPLTRLGQTLDLYQRAMASTSRVMALLDTPIAIHSGNVALPLSSVAGEIKLDDVTFSYAGRQPVVENFCTNSTAVE